MEYESPVYSHLHGSSRLMDCGMLSQQLIGDIDICSIWNGEKRRSFLIQHLHDRRKISICKHCRLPDYAMQPEHFMDPFKEEIIRQFMSV